MDGRISDFTDKMGGQSAVPSGLRPIQRDTPNLERWGDVRESRRDEDEVLGLQNVVPTLAVGRSFDERRGLGSVGGAQFLVIPFDFLCDTPNLERLGYFRASLRDEAEVL